MRRKYIIISLMTLFTTTTFAQDTLGFSADLYKYLLKNDDFNKDGILSQSEINFICCVQLKNMKSIKGISKLVNLKYVTLELDEYDYSELFQLSEVIDLKINSDKIKRKFSIPSLCGFSTTLFSLKIENCIINQESKNLNSLNNFEIDNCILESDISEFFTIKQLNKLEIRKSILNYSIDIKQKNQSLKYLSIHETNINEIPKSIDNLLGAETINISKCNLSYIPITITNLTNLTNLTLTGNSFDTFPPEILLLQSLKYLDLRGNKKQLKLPSDIVKLVNLENIPIFLPNNEDIPKEIYKITKLKELYLMGRELESIPKEIFNLDHLERLYLNDNNIKEIQENIVKLRQLKQLHINRNKLTKIPKYLSLLKNLEEIDLSNNEIFEFNVNCDSLQKLRTIRLGGNKLTNFPYELKKCLKLSTINLQNNNISSIEQIKYGDFQSAYIIEIYGNPIVTNSPFIQKKESIIQLKITGAEDKYNSYNLTEAILKSSPKDIIFSGVILNREINEKSKESFKDVICKVKVLDCYHDNCNQDTLIITRSNQLTIGDTFLIFGKIDNYEFIDNITEHKVLSNNNVNQTDDQYVISNDYYNCFSQLVKYNKSKYTGKVKLIDRKQEIAEGSFLNGKLNESWEIYFTHKDVSNSIKSKLNFNDGVLDGEQTYYTYINGGRKVNLMSQYTNGKLKSTENHNYNQNGLSTIQKKVLNYGSYYSVESYYELSPSLNDTFSLSHNYNLNNNNNDNHIDNFTQFPTFRHGPFKFSHDKKHKSKGEYFYGKKVGLWYANKLCCQDTIAIYDKTDLKDNVVAYHENGNIMIEGKLVKNQKQGIWRVYNINGILEKSFSFVNDKLDGISENYVNGKIERRLYKNGIRLEE